MGIEIFYYSKQTNPTEEDYIWSINDLSLVHLAECNDLYKQRTGKFIDEYGDLKLPKGTISPLYECVLEILEKEKDLNKLRTLIEFRDILTGAITNDKGLVFYGD
ncbi:MAG: hypothetical protein HUN04_11205 [Desulfobacter sp.]|nr:MAG: hypothetical protein HUN04_11205 [Desulfobacter sp.]